MASKDNAAWRKIGHQNIAPQERFATYSLRSNTDGSTEVVVPPACGPSPCPHGAREYEVRNSETGRNITDTLAYFGKRLPCRFKQLTDRRPCLQCY